MNRYTPGQILFLFALIAGFGLFTSLAIAKWQHEKRLKEAKLQAAREKLEKKAAPAPPPAPPGNP